jgi:hypothetical protein
MRRLRDHCIAAQNPFLPGNGASSAATQRQPIWNSIRWLRVERRWTWVLGSPINRDRSDALSDLFCESWN